MKDLPILLEAPQVKQNEKFVLALVHKFSLVADNQIITSIDGENLRQKIFTTHNQSTRAYHYFRHLYSIAETFDQIDFPSLDQPIVAIIESTAGHQPIGARTICIPRYRFGNSSNC